VDVGTGVRASKTPERTLYGHTRIGADLGDTEQRLETKRGAGREPHDQHGVLAMLNTTARGQKRKREHREAKRRSDQKIKARAWRNKRNKNKRWRKDNDKTQEINQNGNTKPGLDYAGVTPLSSRDRAGESCYAA